MISTITFRSLIFTICFLILGQLAFSQDGKLFFIKDNDTLNVEENNIKVFLEVNDRLIPFNQSDNLIYPDSINLDSINSIVVTFKTDTLSFYNFKEDLKFLNLPLEIIKIMKPFYSIIFSEKRNMYFTVDSYPFEGDIRIRTAKDSSKRYKIPKAKMIIAELFYQVIETQAVKPKKMDKRDKRK